MKVQLIVGAVFAVLIACYCSMLAALLFAPPLSLLGLLGFRNKSAKL